MDKVRIIGIDPGLRRCGWGVIESLGNRLTFVASGTITPRVDDDLAVRLTALYRGLSELIMQYRPDEAAVASGDHSCAHSGQIYICPS